MIFWCDLCCFRLASSKHRSQLTDCIVLALMNMIGCRLQTTVCEYVSMQQMLAHIHCLLTV